MKTTGRLKSMNMEDKRPGKIHPWYEGLPLADTFRKQYKYEVPKPKGNGLIKKRGRQLSIGTDKHISTKKGGGYR